MATSVYSGETWSCVELLEWDVVVLLADFFGLSDTASFWDAVIYPF